MAGRNFVVFICNMSASYVKQSRTDRNVISVVVQPAKNKKTKNTYTNKEKEKG